MLSLDGGGVRGAIAIGFLERLESLIEEIEGRRTLLCDWFDFIGGTSTGAIIAGALALGYRATEVRKFYHALGPRVFRRSFWRILVCVLPFPLDEYQRDFSSPAAVTALRSLFESANAHLILPGERTEGARSYERANEVILANIDLLVAIWDGKRASGRAGTGDVVQSAIPDGFRSL
jgi:predicted acylesterase/phospholipase RssA